MNEESIKTILAGKWGRLLRTQRYLCQIRNTTDSQLKILSFGNEALESALFEFRYKINPYYLYRLVETVIAVYQSGGFYSSAHYEDHFNSDGHPTAEFRAALYRIEAIEAIVEKVFGPDNAPWYSTWVHAVNQIWPHKAIRAEEQLNN